MMAGSVTTIVIRAVLVVLAAAVQTPRYVNEVTPVNAGSGVKVKPPSLSDTLPSDTGGASTSSNVIWFTALPASCLNGEPFGIGNDAMSGVVRAVVSRAEPTTGRATAMVIVALLLVTPLLSTIR